MCYTPGPWKIEPHGNGFALYAGRDSMRHGMNLVHLTDPAANWQANAKLIAAAPELVEMIKRLQCAIGNHCIYNCLTVDDLEDEGSDLLEACKAADELLRAVGIRD